MVNPYKRKIFISCLLNFIEQTSIYSYTSTELVHSPVFRDILNKNDLGNISSIEVVMFLKGQKEFYLYDGQDVNGNPIKQFVYIPHGLNG